MSEKQKPIAIALLKKGTDPKTVAEQTGYSIRRIYDFKKQIETEDGNPATPKKPAINLAMQLQPAIHPAEIDKAVEAKLEKALDTLLEHLTIEVTQDTIDGIVKIVELLNSLRSPIPNIAELINDKPQPTEQEGTDIHPRPNEEQEPTGASADANNFVEILTKTSEGTNEVD